jgi:hypothetical protein
MKRFKVTRIEIWEVPDEQPNEVEVAELQEDLLDSIQDDILNSQDNQTMVGEMALVGGILVIPKEIVELKVEPIID